jgi:hypothetical protein
MRKTILTLLLAFIWMAGFSQNTMLDKTKKFTLSDGNSETISVKIENLSDGTFKTTLRKSDDNHSDFSLKPFEYETFSIVFRQKFKELINKEIKSDSDEVKFLFYDALLASKEGDTPDAGSITIKENAQLGYLLTLNVKSQNYTKDLIYYLSPTEIELMAKKLKKKNDLIHRLRDEDVIINFLNNHIKTFNWKNGPEKEDSFLKFDRFFKTVKRKDKNNGLTCTIKYIDELRLLIEDVDMEVYNGFIENISVRGQIIKNCSRQYQIANNKKLIIDLDSIKKNITEGKGIKKLLFSLDKLKSKISKDSTNILAIDSAITNLNSNLIQLTEKYQYDKIQKILCKNIAVIKHSTIIKDHCCFTNNIPIGISTKHSIEKRRKKDLVSSRYIYNHIEVLLSAKLCDIIEYEPNLAINTKDYSPANDVYHFKKGDKNIRLKKEKTENLLDAKIFTDFNAYGENNGNGIIQTEISKCIPINTNRHAITKTGSTNYGWFQYINPFASFSRVEDGNHALELSSSDVSSNENGILGTNLIDLYKNERLRLGADINLFVLDAPQNKLNLWLDAGAQFGQVKYNDTTTVKNSKEKDFIANSLYYYGKLKCKIFPDERYGVDISYNIGHYDILDERLEEEKDKDVEKDSFYWLQGLEMQVFIKSGNRGKVFFKYKISSPLDNFNNNFTQLLFGYSFDITQKIKSK